MTRGGARERKGHFYARARYGNGARLEMRVPWATSLEDAAARGEVIAEIADALVGAGRRDLVRGMARELAKAATPKALATARKAADALVSGAIKAGSARDITIRLWGDRYTSGELARTYPDHVKAKDYDDEASRLRSYVYPHVGDVPVNAFTLAHAELVMSKLPPKLRPATRRHVAQIVGRLMHLAVYPGRLLPASPIPRGWLPKLPKRKHYSCLFPREEALFLCSPATPEAFRLFIGVLDREGARLSEILDSEWWQWNLVEGTFTTTQTKTHDPRLWAIAPDVLEAMRIWRARHPDLKRPFEGVDAGDRTRIAVRLRAALKAAGVERAELFAATEHTGALRAHDMRATFVTISLAQGRTETWIRDRTAHKSTHMIDRYRRAARQVAELKLGPLVDLVAGLGWGKGGGTTSKVKEET